MVGMRTRKKPRRRWRGSGSAAQATIAALRVDGLAYTCPARSALVAGDERQGRRYDGRCRLRWRNSERCLELFPRRLDGLSAARSSDSKLFLQSLDHGIARMGRGHLRALPSRDDPAGNGSRNPSDEAPLGNSVLELAFEKLDWHSGLDVAIVMKEWMVASADRYRLMPRPPAHNPCSGSRQINIRS
jgi:hypothetical protein